MAHRLSNLVRRKFIDYFTIKHGHKFVKSSSVIPPYSDRSLSWVNAGMNQFKDIILADQSNYTLKRACNYQKCIRVGGKMCDLDFVGRDLRHHTFFEMLGNWSFGDYGREQACEWALDFLVNYLSLDMSKMTVTYFKSDNDEDLESKNIWLRLGFSLQQVIPNTKGDNFWDMGTSGPCGMSTEIFYHLDSSREPMEIWNLVFIDRQKLADEDKVIPLRNKFVDTGMGLERILAVLKNVESNYDTDLFESQFKVIESKSSVAPYGGTLEDQLDISYRVLVDHCRMITMALADGAKPGRKGAAFDIRSIIKKTVLLAQDSFNQETPRYLLFDLVDENIEILGSAYPELPLKLKDIRRIIASESKRYLLHLSRQ